MPPVIPTEPLTRREIEVLHLAMETETAREIGDRIGISRRTVEFHLNNVRTKLDVHSTHRAIIVGLVLGVISLG